MLVSEGHVSIIRLQNNDDDFSLLFKWLNDKKLLNFIEGTSTTYTRSQIVEKYGPRARGEHYVTPCIIKNNNVAIGYLQFYQLQEVEIQEYGAKTDQLQYGIDLFIGETDCWGQGMGTTALELIINYLFTEQGATDLFVDPQTSNTRAIRSYEKCGFKKVKILHEHEIFDGVYKDNQLMRVSRDEFFTY
ncbi:GCN5-related N-acetyltransferase [Paenibacillus curdlanolyticus YK9]|uniref:GCN5-related N-acetyltransferase n=1 Tax=Paenibacillus curdlanolyticus YK9 TaxID=717606 RepID=E0IFA7_9BACL|nr:GNAT family N-acetyltransferase [Paenibacillus curdlanolyticus]EFM08883.1 GCN5-related N-acetyltransferase [Paenibacillus curdlanolyticus YK9]